MVTENTETTHDSDRIMRFDEVAGMFFTCMEDTWFPFGEDEDARITGVGHQDKDIFALSVNKYDELASGCTFDEEDKWTADDVTHGWGLIKPTSYGEDVFVHMVNKEEKGAIPLTMMWNVR